MSILKINIIANFAGKLWTILLGLVLIPFYIRFIGIESYGLVSFFVIMQGTVSLLDFGLSATINREIARFSKWPERFGEARDLARTLEIIYWLVGLFIGCSIYIASSWIATNWLQSGTLSDDVVSSAVAMMGISIGFQWPISLYSGGLMGLERQVLLNFLNITIKTIQGLGALFVLWMIAPTLKVFFSWQIFINIVNVGLFSFLFWRYMLPGSRFAHVKLQSLSGVWRFTLGMGATGLVTFLLSQLDKVILSRVLPLDLLGYYNIANQISLATRMPAASIFAAILPRFSGLLAIEDSISLKSLYHTGCQLVSIVVLPASFTTAIFAHELIFIWTGNETIAQMASPVASILIIGSALNSMLGIPYDLTVANGWSSFGFYQNLISSVVLVPLMLVLVFYFGGIGAATAWLILNLGYMIFSPSIIHRRILPGELRQWYIVDIGRPFLLSMVTPLIGRLFWPTNAAPCFQLMLILFLWLITLIACVFVLPIIRQRIWTMLDDLSSLLVSNRAK